MLPAIGVGAAVTAVENGQADTVFDDLPGTVLSDLAGRVRLRTVRPGQVVIKDYYAELPISIKVTGRYHDIGSFAADHVITEPEVFASAVATAVEAARADWLVTIGIEPTHAATGFGYIGPGEEIEGLDGVHFISRTP